MLIAAAGALALAAIAVIAIILVDGSGSSGLSPTSGYHRVALWDSSTRGQDSRVAPWSPNLEVRGGA